MPPSLRELRETESVSDAGEMVAPKSSKSSKKKQPSPPSEYEEDELEEQIEVAGKNNEEADDEEEEVEYVVEKIISHVEDGGVIKYQVKWQGYSSRENTWEPEENLDGAVDILQAFFKKIGGRPEAGSKANSAKKRGRKSAGAVDTPEPPKSKKSKTEFSGKRGRPAKNGSADLEWPLIDDNWQPPPPRKDAWEELIVSVETIEADENGQKWAFLLWAAEDSNGKKRTSKAMLASVYKAAPQAMLRFYEEHLVFTDARDKKRSDSAAIPARLKDE